MDALTFTLLAVDATGCQGNREVARAKAGALNLILDQIEANERKAEAERLLAEAKAREESALPAEAAEDGEQP